MSTSDIQVCPMGWLFEMIKVSRRSNNASFWSCSYCFPQILASKSHWWSVAPHYSRLAVCISRVTPGLNGGLLLRIPEAWQISDQRQLSPSVDAITSPCIRLFLDIFWWLIILPHSVIFNSPQHNFFSSFSFPPSLLIEHCLHDLRLTIIDLCILPRPVPVSVYFARSLSYLHCFAWCRPTILHCHEHLHFTLPLVQLYYYHCVVDCY